MRQVTWREPNFRCQVSDTEEGSRYWTFEFGKTEDEANKSLAERGLFVHRLDPYDFNEWQKLARSKTAAVIWAFRRTGKLDIDGEFWKELKDYLFCLFNGMCAYCESRVPHVAYGDVEHFRPKQGVSDEPSHKGYYWLAYDHSNWFPACSVCNTSGKGNKFPIAGKRAFRPHHKLSSEDPKLLNPFLDHPYDDLEFYIDKAGLLCLAKALSPRGQATIDTCKLNRPELARNRKGEWDRAISELERASLSREMHDIDSYISLVKEGKFQYSRACLSAIREFPETFKERVKRRIQELGVR